MIRPLANLPLKTNLLILLIFFAFGGRFVRLQAPPRDASGIAAVTTRGGPMVIVRYPLPPDGPRRQIVVFDATTLAHPQLAVIADADAHAQDSDLGRAVQLPPDQWQAIDALRQQWCADPPRLPSAASAAPVYDIGLRCEYSNHGMPRAVYLRVPGDALPSSVQSLIALSPPPAQ